MANRIICCYALQHLRNIANKHILQNRQRPLVVLWADARSRQQYGGVFVQPAKLLHTKISDKEAKLDEQRKANSNRSNTFDGIAANSGEQRNGSNRLPDNAASSYVTTKMESEPLPNNEDADTFGGARLDEHEDEGDAAEEEFIGKSTRQARKMRAAQYAWLIKDHLKAHRLKEAIAVLEQRMLKEDRVKPDHYIYNLLISGCAKAGYTRKAFSLYTRMRQRGLKVTAGTYTSLFNACANAPSAVDGLERAKRLRETLLEKGVEPNVKNYNAMIKAYGRCGDVKTAFQLADEMNERQLPLNTDTYNFLLQASASDADYGFRHCLLTWHKMIARGLKPDYYTFNAVLRCARDCGFGDLASMQQVLEEITQRFDGGAIQIASGQLLLDGAVSGPSSESSLPVSVHAETPTQLEIPNLLQPRPHLGSLVSIAEVNQPHERFLLLGGMSGYLQLMQQHNVTPNIQTMTTMLEVVPPTNAAEKQLLTIVRQIGLKADIDFFNVLIKKRAMRFDYDGGKEVLSMIRTAGLHPDIVTYGVLALGCQTAEAARELLQQMQSSGVRMNIQILGAMLRQGCATRSFPYIVDILQISLDENVRPNEHFIRHLHNFYVKCARIIDSRHPATKKDSFRYGHAKFCTKMRLYFEEHGIADMKLEDAVNKIKERPYEHYKEDTVDGLEPVKNEKLARQQKQRKYIKKIKIDALADGADMATSKDETAPKGSAAWNKFRQPRQIEK